MLKDIIPPTARKYVYMVYALVALGLGATQVAYVSLEAGQPDWLTAALAVVVFIGAPLGFTAASNITRPATAPEHRAE